MRPARAPWPRCGSAAAGRPWRGRSAGRGSRAAPRPSGPSSRPSRASRGSTAANVIPATRTPRSGVAGVVDTRGRLASPPRPASAVRCRLGPGPPRRSRQMVGRGPPYFTHKPRRQAFDNRSSKPRPKYQMRASTVRTIRQSTRDEGRRNVSAGSKTGTSRYAAAQRMNGTRTASPCMGRGRLLTSDG